MFCLEIVPTAGVRKDGTKSDEGSGRFGRWSVPLQSVNVGSEEAHGFTIPNTTGVLGGTTFK